MAEIQILGSAAAEGIPAMFCNCRVCRDAWKNGGKNVRMRTAYKLNDEVRIDFGPDTLAQEYKFHLHSEKLKHLFITHSHEDHLYLELLNYRRPGFSVVEEDNILNLYGNPGVIHMLQKFFWSKPDFLFTGDYKKYRLNPVVLKPFEPVVLEDQDMEFYPLPAVHQTGMPGEYPNIFVFRNGSSWGMIANDSGCFCKETWHFLEEKKFKLNMVVCDCTGGIMDYNDCHMGGRFVLETKNRLKQTGCMDDSSIFVINHFSHNGKASHTELEAYFNKYDIQVAYDGMVIKF